MLEHVLLQPLFGRGEVQVGESVTKGLHLGLLELRGTARERIWRTEEERGEREREGEGIGISG